MTPPSASGPLKAEIERKQGPYSSSHAPHTTTAYLEAIYLRYHLFCCTFIPLFILIMARCQSFPGHPHLWTLIPTQLCTSLLLILSPPLPTESFPRAFWNSGIKKNLFPQPLFWMFSSPPCLSETWLPSEDTTSPKASKLIVASSLTTFESLGQEVGYMLLLTPASRSFSFSASKNKTPPALTLISRNYATHISLYWPVNGFWFTVTFSIIPGDSISTQMNLPTSWALISSNSSPPVVLISDPTSGTHSHNHTLHPVIANSNFKPPTLRSLWSSHSF